MNDQFPFGYERIAATTWAYLSSLLMLCVFFKFNRFWSVRNFDLLLIILLAPGILFVEGGRQWVARDQVKVRQTDRSDTDVGAETEAGSRNSSGDATENPENNRPRNTQENSGSVEGGISRAGGSDASTDVADPQSVDSENAESAGAENNRAENNGAENNGGPRARRSDQTQPSLDGVTASGATVGTVIVDEVTPFLSRGNPNSRGHQLQRLGYYWLFVVAGLFMIRMLIDPMFVRRPLLEPNLAIGGLVFMGCSLMIFLFANIVSASPNRQDLRGAQDAVRMLQRKNAGEEETEQLRQTGPGYWLMYLFPIIPSFGDGQAIMKTDSDPELNMDRYVVASKSLAIVSQNLIVLGLVLFGFLHFRSFQTGVGMATIYLMLPYTAVFTGHVIHALPAALLVWALVSFRRPGLAGFFIGLATGVSYYALFLLPLWMSFYWEKGRTRFLIGFGGSLSICVAGLIFTSYDAGDFFTQLKTMFGFWLPLRGGLEGIWELGWDDSYRVPLLVAFMALSVSFAFWPAQKNLGTLISYSCVIMAAVQFWHGFGGGLYMAWYVPLALMVFFRPNTSGRVASVELGVAEEARRLRSSELTEELLPID